MSASCILLASHGTTGARAAEARALAEAQRTGAVVMHLLVVPSFWADIRGDDWLNGGPARDAFSTYVEDLLASEVEQEISRLGKAARATGITLHSHVRRGQPTQCLLDFAEDCLPQLVIIGTPRRKGEPGYRSRMTLEKLARGLNAPLLVVPRQVEQPENDSPHE